MGESPPVGVDNREWFTARVQSEREERIRESLEARIRAERQGSAAMSEISTHGDLDNTSSGLRKTRDDF